MFKFLKRFFKKDIHVYNMPIMYVLVRNDLAPIYRCVQGAHALAQYALEYPENLGKWKNEYLIFLGVRNHKDIILWYEKLKAAHKSISCFQEPDLDGHITAVACFDTGEIFKGLRLTS